MRIAGFSKLTLLDFPERVAATVFVSGCNFRCPFCHNGGLVLESSDDVQIDPQEVLSFLSKRKNVLKGVCITGGEPTLQPDLEEFIRQVKSLGYQVKLDTNGYMPDVLEGLLQAGLLDYVAMDIKNCPEKYAETVGIEKEQFQIERIQKSMELLMQGSIEYEFRTTVVKPLHTREDICKIGKWIADCPHYFLQQYRDGDQILGAVTRQGETFDRYSRQEMEAMAEELSRLIKKENAVALRGVE